MLIPIVPGEWYRPYRRSKPPRDTGGCRVKRPPISRALLEAMSRIPAQAEDDLSEYHACRRRATPIWLNSEQRAEMRALYLKARGTKKRRVPLSVDHIVPLRGSNVCGLHVPWNLRLIPLIENFRKGNRRE